MSQNLKSKLAGIQEPDPMPALPTGPASKQEALDALSSIVADVKEGERDWRPTRLRNFKSFSPILRCDGDLNDDDPDDGSPSWPKRPIKKPKGTRHQDEGITEMFHQQHQKQSGSIILPRTFSKSRTTVLGVNDLNILVSDNFYSLPVPPRLLTLYRDTIMPLIKSVWPHAEEQPRWELFPGSAADPQLIEIRCIVRLSDQPLWLYLHSGYARTAAGITGDTGAILTQPRNHDLIMDCLDLLDNNYPDDFIGWFSTHANDPTGGETTPND